jgi:hypothetical protein
MSHEKVRWLLDANLSWDRSHGRVEGIDGVLRGEHIDDAEAVLALSGYVDQQAFER